MLRRYKLLFLVFLVICSGTMYWGCSQTEDVMTPTYQTDVFLSPERLPDNPPGMIYTLWVADGDKGDTVYVGRFGYDYSEVEFLDTNGSARADSNQFFFEGDIYRYTHLFVSIDTLDFSTSSPGPIMLIDDVTRVSEDPVDLVFPLTDTLWESTLRFNMETMSDDNRATYDGYGLWFAHYRVDTTFIRDTFSMTSFVLDSVVLDDIGDQTDTNSVKDTANYREETVELVYGLDTFSVEKAIFDYVYHNDADSPWVVYRPQFTFSTGSSQRVIFDIFSQDEFDLIDYSAWGWKYKGWVVSSVIPTSAIGEMTAPAGIYNTPYDSLMPGADGGLISTGTFSDITAADDISLYAQSDRIPPFPGEDFLSNLPTGFNGDLVPNGNRGTVFVTLEPDNFLTDTTNFPLIVYFREVPNSRDTLYSEDYHLTMDGNMHTNDMYTGFPSISVTFRSH